MKSALWIVGLLAVFVPLSIRLYRKLDVGAAGNTPDPRRVVGCIGASPSRPPVT